MSNKYQWKQIGINNYEYFVNVFLMGQWICKNCKEIVLEDYTYEEDCGCCKPDLVMYQDWVMDNFKADGYNRRKKDGNV